MKEIYKLKNDIRKLDSSINVANKLLTNNESSKFVPFRIVKKWGYSDRRRNILIPCIYESVGFFYNGLATVKFSNKWGMIDQNGMSVISFDYDFMDDSSRFCEGPVMVKIGNQYGYIDKQGTHVIPIIYDHAEPFSEGLAYVRDECTNAYIDTNGRIVISINTGYVGLPFKDSIAILFFDYQDGYHRSTCCNTIAIDKSGKELGRYDFSYRHGKIAENANGGFVLVNEAQFSYEPRSDSTDEWYESSFQLLNSGKILDGKSSIVGFNHLGIITDYLVLEHLGFTEAGAFCEGFAKVKLKFLHLDPYHGEVPGRSDWCFIDKEGVIKFGEFSNCGNFRFGLARIKKCFDSLYGYINTDGEEVIPAMFTIASDFFGDYAIVETKELENYIQIIDRSGKIAYS